MRAVIDTNVLLSALLWGGTPRALLEHVRNGTVTLISSQALLAELARVLERPKFDVILLRTNTPRAQSLAEVRQLAEVIDPPPATALARCAALVRLPVGPMPSLQLPHRAHRQVAHAAARNAPEERDLPDVRRVRRT